MYRPYFKFTLSLEHYYNHHENGYWYRNTNLNQLTFYSDNNLYTSTI